MDHGLTASASSSFLGADQSNDGISVVHVRGRDSRILLGYNSSISPLLLMGYHRKTNDEEMKSGGSRENNRARVQRPRRAARSSCAAAGSRVSWRGARG